MDLQCNLSYVIFLSFNFLPLLVDITVVDLESKVTYFK